MPHTWRSPVSGGGIRRTSTVRWTKGTPIAAGTARHDFQSAAKRTDLTPPELAIFETSTLSFTDSIVSKVNTAKTAADTQYVASAIGPTTPAKFDGGG